MICRTKFFLAAVVLIAVVLPGQANDNKRQATRAVIAGCQAVAKGDVNDNPLQQGYCLGMIQAIAFTNEYAPSSKRFCPFPPSLLVKDYLAVVVANSNKVSTQIFEDPVEFITEVLRYSYPCKN